MRASILFYSHFKKDSNAFIHSICGTKSYAFVKRIKSISMVAILTRPYPMYTKWDQRMVEHLIRSQECNPSFETLHSGDCVHDGRFSQDLPLYCSVSTVRLYFCRQTAFCFDKALSTNGFVRFYFAFFCVGISIFLNRSRWFRFIFPLLWISFMILLFLFSLRKRHSNAHTSLDAQRQWTQWQ